MPEPVTASAGALARAEEFLRAVCTGTGTRPAREVVPLAAEAGISVATLRRARRALGIRAVRVGGLASSGRWDLSALESKTLRNEWRTPDVLFRELDEEFHFVLDAAARRENAKCTKFYTREDDGLAQPWLSPTFVNPPFSEQGRWVAKAAHECDVHGVRVVALLMCDPSTRYWHEHIINPGREVRFLKGRVKFVGLRPSHPTFACAVAVFSPPPQPGGAPREVAVAAPEAPRA